MLNYLNIFDLYDVRIACVKGESYDNFVLKMPSKDITKDTKIAFFIVGKHFEMFTAKNSSFLYDKLEIVVKQRGYGYNDNISNIIFDFLSRYFRKYVKKYEIEILCDIEREKSPFYKNKIM